MRILGVDPGSRYTGFGVIEARGGDSAALDFGRIHCGGSQPLCSRLHQLGTELVAVTSQWKPDLAVMETPYHGINSRSLIVLSQARGALLAALGGCDIEVLEYSPAEVKSSVTGSGRADKTQVARMVAMLLSLGDEPLSEDASDALAVAICGAHRYRLDRLAGR